MKYELHGMDGQEWLKRVRLPEAFDNTDWSYIRSRDIGVGLGSILYYTISVKYIKQTAEPDNLYLDFNLILSKEDEDDDPLELGFISIMGIGKEAEGELRLLNKILKIAKKIIKEGRPYEQ